MGEQDDIRLLSDTEESHAVKDRAFPEKEYVLVDLNSKVDGAGGLICYEPLMYFDSQEELEAKMDQFS